MNHFSFPPTRPFKGVLRGDGTPGFTEVPYFGVLVPWVRIRRWRRPTRTQAAGTDGALLACSIPDPPPAARAHHCDRVAAGVRMLCIITPLSRKRHLQLSRSICGAPYAGFFA